MNKLNSIFFKGLILVLPVTLTFYLLFWVSLQVEQLFGSGVKMLVGQDLYIPGAGIMLTVLCIFLVGLLATNWFTARIFSWMQDRLEAFPLIKVIYNPLKDLMALLPTKGHEAGQKVVLVEMGGSQVMGLVTRESLPEIKRGDLTSVYVPFSYMLGGLTLLVPTEKITKLDLPVDEALKLSVTAWIKAPPSNKS